MLRITAILVAISLLACDPAGASMDEDPGVFVASLPDNSCVYTDGSTLQSLSIDGKPGWNLSFEDGPFVAAPAAAPDGTIFVRTDDALHAVSGQGELLWTLSRIGRPDGYQPAVLAPAVLASGTVAVVVASDELLGVDARGNRRWNAKVPQGTITGPPVPCANGNLLVQTSTGALAVSDRGEISWARSLEELRSKGAG